MSSALQKLTGNYMLRTEDFYSNNEGHQDISEDPDLTIDRSDLRESSKNQHNTHNRQRSTQNEIDRSQELLLGDISTTEHSEIFCKEHSEEELQFFSLTDNKALCPECLLTGKYTGCEVLSLKKAVTKIKPILNGLVKKIEEQVKGSNSQKTNAKGNEEVERFSSEYKQELRAQFDKLREAIDKKENEIFSDIDNIKNTQDKPESKKSRLNDNNGEILKIKEEIESKINKLNDIGLCQFYSSKGVGFKSVVEDHSGDADFSPKRDLSESYSIFKCKKEIERLVAEVSDLTGLESKAQKNALTGYLNGPSKTNLSMENGIEKLKSSLSSKNNVRELLSSASLQSVQLQPKTPTPRSENKKQKYLQISSDCASPINEVKREIDILARTPTSMQSQQSNQVTEFNVESSLEDTFKKIFNRTEQLEKNSQRFNSGEFRRINERANTQHSQPEPTGTSTKNLKSYSTAKIAEPGQPAYEKDASRKFWNTYKELADNNGRKTQNHPGSQHVKVVDGDNNKPKLVAKSFLQDFSIHNLGNKKANSTETQTMTKEPSDAFNILEKFGLGSRKNTLLSTPKSTAKDLNVQSSSSNLNMFFNGVKGRGEDSYGKPGSSRSHGNSSSNLSLKLGKLKRDLDFGL